MVSSAAPHALGLRPLCLPRELAAWLRVSPRTVRRRMLDGMPHKMVGGLVRFDPEEVLEWLNRTSSRERKA